MSHSPFISIVTITKNDATRLQRTLNSIELQDSEEFEYLVVDGASTDETVSALKAAAQAGKIDQWISEPDAGIFDAMNKGALRARGEWIIFINAGDELFEPSTIRKLSGVLREHAKCDCIIGAVEHVYPGGYTKIRQPRKMDLRWGMRFSHQATAVKTHYQQQNPFLLNDGVAADYGFFLRAIKQQACMHFTELAIARFYLDGISSLDYAENVRREKALYQQYMGNNSLVFCYRWAYCRLAKMAKATLPTGLVNKIQGLK